MVQVHLSQWPGATISVLLQSAGKIEMKGKGAIRNATCSYYKHKKIPVFLSYRLINTGFELTH